MHCGATYQLEIHCGPVYQTEMHCGAAYRPEMPCDAFYQRCGAPQPNHFLLMNLNVSYLRSIVANQCRRRARFHRCRVGPVGATVQPVTEPSPPGPGPGWTVVSAAAAAAAARPDRPGCRHRASRGRCLPASQPSPLLMSPDAGLCVFRPGFRRLCTSFLGDPRTGTGRTAGTPSLSLCAFLSFRLDRLLWASGSEGQHWRCKRVKVFSTALRWCFGVCALT